MVIPRKLGWSAVLIRGILEGERTVRGLDARVLVGGWEEKMCREDRARQGKGSRGVSCETFVGGKT
jgi:hypothetical protein